MSKKNQLVPTAQKTDADKATDLRERTQRVLGPLLTLMNDAHKEGFDINFQLGRDPWGNIVVQGIHVSKRL